MTQQSPAQIFRQISFFKYSTDEFLAELAQVSSVRLFRPDEVILAQGQTNQTLFFLLKGQVEITVDGGVVARLSNVGDLIGEMSVITQNPAAATTKATIECELLAIDTKKIQSLSGSIGDHLQKMLYKIYAFILSDKLKTTNEKAKHVERLNSELLVAQKKLETLYKSEKTLKTKRVLYVDAEKKNQTMAKTALLGTGVNLDVAGSVDEAKQKIQANKIDLIFLTPVDVNFAEELKKSHPDMQIVMTTSTPMVDWYSHVKQMSFLPQIVSRSESDKVFTIKNIMTTVVKLATQDLFGFEKYLNWGVEVHELAVKHSDDRTTLISTMDNMFQGMAVRKTIRERIGAVTEELLMNAIYDAPIDKDGKSIFNHLSRKDKVDLAPHQQSKLRYGTDGFFAAVSVVDPFGSLSGNVLLKYLENCYTQAKSLNEGTEKGGAGRGLHQIIENSDLVVFNIQPKQKTEVISLFYLDSQAMADKHPSFHFFC